MIAPLRGLRGRFLSLAVAIFLSVGALAGLGFFQVAGQIIDSLGAGYATQYAHQQRGRILAKLQRELVLAQKLVDSPLLKRWAQNEADPELTRAALAELDSYRRFFDDRSYFFIIDASQNYYFNNAANEFAGKELRYVVKPADPSMAWYFHTMRDVEDFDLHIDNSVQLGLTKVWINAIVRDGPRKLGLGGSGMDLSAFLKDIVRVSDPGVETVLVNEQGFLQGHSDQRLMERNAQIRDERKRLTVFGLIDDPVELQKLKKVLTEMASGTHAPDQQMALTLQGRRRLAAISYLPEIKWATIVLVDPGAVIQLKTFRPILILLGSALLVTILLVSWLLERLVLRRLARLTASTEEISAGRYDLELKVDRADEIGQLTSAFKRMAATIGDYLQNLEAKVASRTQDLQHANNQLAASNKQIMDSIEYASLIQASLLSPPSELDRLLRDYLVLWLPRDVVGGDFHALYVDENQGFLLAVGDCTGHGVPGAFMTMAAKALLDRAVASLGITDPAALTGELHRGVRALLQSGAANETNSGLDLALLYVPPTRDRVCFTGAKLDLWVMQEDGQFATYKGDRSSVGYRKTPANQTFSNQQLAMAPGMRCYLFTDGILDQNGGERGIGLGKTRLMAALQAWREHPLKAQAALLAELLNGYRGDYPQRDDITLVALLLDPPPLDDPSGPPHESLPA